MACGDSLAGEHGGQVNFETPYLTYVFTTIGVAGVDILVLKGLNRDN
jgi:hypothetical protein